MYKQTETSGIIREADGACIPSDPANRDFQEFLDWLAAGNSIESTIDLEEIKRSHIAELEQKVHDRICSGFQSIALGTPHCYSSQEDDQMNLIAAFMMSLHSPDPIYYVCLDVATGIKAPVLHTADQMRQVFQDGSVTKSTLIFHFHAARQRIEAATSLDELRAIVAEAAQCGFMQTPPDPDAN